MSTLENSGRTLDTRSGAPTLAGSAAAVDALRALEAASTPARLEDAPRPAEYDPEDFARAEYDGATRAVQDETAEEDTKKKANRRKRVKQLMGYVTAAAVITATLLGPLRSFWGIPASSSEGGSGSVPVVPVPADEAFAIRQVLADNPNWYSAEYDVYLHFNNGSGWVYDHGNFHRLTWAIENEGTEDERLHIETAYMYYDASDVRVNISRDAYVGVSRTGTGEFALDGAVGIEDHDYERATFAPIDSIPVDSSVVDGVEGFGTMSIQKILETIGYFAPTDIRPQSGLITYASIGFMGGMLTANLSNGDSTSVAVTYAGSLAPNFETENNMYITEDGSQSVIGRYTGGVIFREDGVYVGMTSFMSDGDVIFYGGPVSGVIEPDPVDPDGGEHADDAFPSLVNLMPDAPAPDWGSLGEYYVVVGGTWVVAGDAYGEGWTGTYPGVSYDAATNTLTLNNVTAEYLEFNWMGNGFTVNLVGDNHLGYILGWGFYTGGSVTFTGTGSLTVNEGLGSEYGILLRAEDSQTCIMVDSGVTLDVYGSEGAILVDSTTMEKAIYYLKPLKMEGGVRAVVGQADEDGSSFLVYSVLEEENSENLAKHVRFAS